jgi:hypothetical protein
VFPYVVVYGPVFADRRRPEATRSEVDMAGPGRKPRARKTKSSADAAPIARDGNDGASDRDEIAAESKAAPGDTGEQGDGDPGTTGSSRTTAEHLHESMRTRPDTYGEVF